MGYADGGVNPNGKKLLQDAGEKDSITVVKQLVGTHGGAFPQKAFQLK
jgi:hypothetical protein